MAVSVTMALCVCMSVKERVRERKGRKSKRERDQYHHTLLTLGQHSLPLHWPQEVRSYDDGDVVGAHLGQVSVERELLKECHKKPNGTYTTL